MLTEWNAMYGSALAEAAAAAGTPTWRDAAVGIGEFLLAHLVGDDGRWHRSWQADGGARHLAYAADYAWLVDCFTRLGELTGLAVWTERAVEAAEGLLTLFHDDDGGGFFTTGHDAEALIVRTKEVFDGATPSANAVAALALARLGALTGDRALHRAAREVVDMFGELLARHPTAFAHTVLTADLLVRGVPRSSSPGTARPGGRGPRPVAARCRAGLGGADVVAPVGGRDGDRAYVCRNYACQLPAEDADTLPSAAAVGSGQVEETR